MKGASRLREIVGTADAVQQTYGLDQEVPQQSAPVEAPAPSAGDLAVLDQMLITLVESRGSDLHLTVGSPPMIRVDGGLRPLPGYGKLNSADTALLARAAVNPEQWEIFQRDQEMDFAHSIVGVSRYRGNLYVQRNSCGAVFRAIPHKIKPLDELGMPESVARFAHLPRGLVLVTGPTGSGKTTTLASVLDLANRSRAAHIITIEDPIEFLHPHKRSVVNQREVGSDTEHLRAGAQARAAPGPGHHPGRRAARPGDHRDRADRRGDRSPGAGHPAHAERHPDHRPRHRHLPAAPAAADPRPARGQPAGRGHPGPGAARPTARAAWWSARS